MTKVHVAQSPESTTKMRRVEWNRPMAALSFVIALNMISMPLRAYVTETLPWAGRTQPVEWNGTTYAANSSWMVLQRMQALYNDATLPAKATIFKDQANYTTVMRQAIRFPHDATCDSMLPLMPGAIFYGPGIRNAICRLVNSTDTVRSMAQCQHMRHFGITITEQCVWVYPQHGPTLVVFQSLYQWEQVWFLWIKLALRCLLTAYVAWEVRVQYYSHCRALARDIRAFGIPDPVSPIHRIEVYIGDPTCLTLGNPIVSTCFVVDVWMSVTSVGEVVLQLSQLDDVVLFMKGCLYASRTVWFAYFSMRYTTVAIKWWRISRWVVPLDPTAIAIGATVLSGPLLYINARTSLVWLQYALWSIGVRDGDDATEIFPAIVALTTIIGFMPVVLVACVKASQALVAAFMPSSRTKHETNMDERLRRYSSMEYNDLNQRIVLSLVQSSRSDRTRGGSVYALYDLDAMFRHMPMFSHRSADCFVVGYDSDDVPIEHLRVSLLQCLDIHHSAMSICRTAHPTAICQLNTKRCATSSPASKLRIHSGGTKSQWLL
ncbi:hypothetical protein H310_07112 [Aphanomyces invadans]|uniref:Transmembrane protein n=1 Tax=Aphanomyces invadans TaxID=157072 RepID=A0A024U4H2_9STRA|nr:hypothetical protein H310_07112 [Aphanomyces invadans]ETW00498.1 hypothetical protein H310_07112 [Aphanomyces invadans]|eukprot:XP_008870633.1 hypothetical protein H310_07112 [Aphanomyces invadans]